MAEPRIRKLIQAQQVRLLGSLQDGRARFSQSGDIGTAGLEVPFREFLRAHLPGRLSVSEGEVIDSTGRTSKQTDVLILDHEHPFRLEDDKPGLAMIEGVAAAGELKATLTSQSLQRSIENSIQFKELRAEEAEGTVISANQSDISRFYDHRPYFILAAESQLKLSTVAARLRKIDLETDGQIVDAVYLLDQGWVTNFGDGNGSFQFRAGTGESLQAWIEREIPAGEVLFDFFVWISAVMPRMTRLQSPFLKYL